MTTDLQRRSAPRRPVQLRSPFARAVVPVVGGLMFFVAIGLITWGAAAWISSSGTDATERLAPLTFTVGSTQRAARIVADEGPILFPGLNTTTGERTVVLNHEGDDPARGWEIYFAYPAERDPSCAVEQVIGTRVFIDCDGNRLDVSELAPPPPGVNPIVENRRTLVLDLRGA